MSSDFKIEIKNFFNYDVPEKYQTLYKSFLYDLFHYRLNILYVFAFILYPLAYIFDLLIYPAQANELLKYRVFCSFLSFVLAVLGNKTRFRKYNLLMFYLIFMISILIIIFEINILGGVNSGYYAGINMVFLCVAMISPLNFWQAWISGHIAILLYFLLVVLPTSSIPWDIVWNNLYFLSFTANMVAVSSGISDTNRKKQFVDNLEVQEQEKARSNLLEQKNIEISKQSEQIKQSEQARKDFIANLTHDLKAPLSVIAGHCDILLNSLDPVTEHWKYSKYINYSTNQVSKLIDRLIQISLLDNDEDKPNQEVLDYNLFVNQFYESFIEIARKKEIKYIFNGANKGINVKADRTWLERILGNLVSNAFKFTPKNGTISIKLGIKDGVVFTEISDTGCGIPKQHLNDVFKRKYQTDEGKKHEGAGLGLFIVHERLKLLGGNIVASSTENVGTTFLFNLPLTTEKVTPVNKEYKGEDRRERSDRRAQDDRRQEVRIQTFHEEIVSEQIIQEFNINIDAYENMNTTKPTLLICDDSLGELSVIVQVLHNDYNLLFAKDGLEALDKFNNNREKISLVISDVNMPRMDGLKFCETIYTIKENKHIPLIFLTALQSEENHMKAIRVGASDYIQKPVNTMILKEKIDHWIQKRKSEMLLKSFATSLEEKVDEIVRLQGIIGHEIKNPLTSIIFSLPNLNVLKDKLIEKTEENLKSKWESLNYISKSCNAIKAVLESTKNISSLNKDNFKAVTIRDIVTNSVIQTAHFFEKVGFDLIKNADENSFIIGDRNLICQVLVNLIRNAAESTYSSKRQGFVKLVINKEEKDGVSNIVFTVTDNGEGIHPDNINNLFKFKFTTKGDSGTGIGLYYSRIIVKDHGGEIKVRSKLGEGSEFSIMFPQYVEEAVFV